MTCFRIQGLLILALLAMAAGCRQPTLAERDEQERLDPEVQAAWASSETGTLEIAEAQYEAILLKRPDLARAHLDLAMLLMAADEKPIKAIYHFMRFIELRPDSEKNELIGRNIRLLTVMLSGKAARSRINQLEHQVAALQTENQAMRLGIPLTAVRPVPPGPALVGPGAPAPPTTGPVAPLRNSAGRPRLYTVQAGDSLTRIAQKLYGDGDKSVRIYEANRGKLKNMNALQAGQVLVIPP